MRWIVDGNNVFGSRPDGWWNDRDRAARRFTQRVAEWCRTHDDDVTIVFDGLVPAETEQLAGGNLTVVAAPRRGRDAADDHIVELASHHVVDHPAVELTVVTSDRGLRARLPDAAAVRVIGAGRFRDLIHY